MASDLIWILRNPNGEIIGASAQDAYLALDETDRRQLPMDPHREIVRHLKNDRTQSVSVDGYTLTQEPVSNPYTLPTPAVGAAGEVVACGELLGALEDAKNACELACHNLTPEYERREADSAWRAAVQGLAMYVSKIVFAQKLAHLSAGALAEDVLRCIPADWKPYYAREWGKLGPILSEFIDDLREGRYPAHPSAGAGVSDPELLEAARALITATVAEHTMKERALYDVVVARIESTRPASEGRADV